MATIESIHIFPIKSFDGVAVESAQLRENGSLHHDREYVFRTESGAPVDSLKDKRLYQVRVSFDQDFRYAEFSMPGIAHAPRTTVFDLHHQVAQVNTWMSAALGQPVHLTRDDARGFCDDQELSGPTIISRATLDRVAEVTGQPDVPRRLRTNIVLAGMKPFGEEMLRDQPFTLGDLRVNNSAPVLRCAVIKRDPESGEPTAKFAENYRHFRQQAFAADPSLNQEDAGNYFAAINTAVDGAQRGAINIGDTLEMAKRVAADTRRER